MQIFFSLFSFHQRYFFKHDNYREKNKTMETNKLEEILEKITDYCFEYTYGEISFLKKEILFISDFFSLIDINILPISEEDIKAQIENIKDNDDFFLQKSTELNKKVFKAVRDYKGIDKMNFKERRIRDLLVCFFATDFEPDDLIIEYASYDLLHLGIPEELIIEKLYKYFGDII